MDIERRYLGHGLAMRVSILGALGMVALLVNIRAAAEPSSPGGPPRITVGIDEPDRFAEPGSRAQYIVRIANSGGDAHFDEQLLSPAPEGLVNSTWTCTATSGGNCASASGSGDLHESLHGLRSGAALEYRVTAEIAPTAPPFVSISASANLQSAAQCAGGDTPPCRSTMALATGASLELYIESPAIALVPGERVRYSIISRTQSQRVSTSGTVLRSPVPNGLINSHWTCISSVGACAAASGSGAIEQVLGDFSQGEVRYQIDATVAADPPATIVQSATAIPPFGGSCAESALNGPTRVSSPCTARKALATSARILASRTEDYSPDGNSVSNRFILENIGNSAAGSVVTAPVPLGASSLSWVCSGEGAACPQASGVGAISQTISEWPAAGRLTYDLLAQIGTPTAAGVTNRLSVTPAAGGKCAEEGIPSPCPATIAAELDHGGLHIAEKVDRLGAASGQIVKYTVTIGNSSTDSVDALVLSVPLPLGIAAFEAWTCVSENAAGNCSAVSGSGPIKQRLSSFGPSASLIYTIQAQVAAAAPATIVGRASLTAPASASQGCSLAPNTPLPCLARSEFSSVPIIALDQSASAANLSPGSRFNYFLEATNLGADAGRVQVQDFVPFGLSGSSWTCAGFGMDCPAASGSGAVSELLPQMPAGAGLRYHVTAVVDASPPALLVNTLTAIPPSAGRCHSGEPRSLTSRPCTDRVETSFLPKLVVTQTAAERQLLLGGVAHYQVTVKNQGGMATNTLLSVELPEGIDRFDWTCTGFAGAMCPQLSANGAIHETIPSLPLNGYLNYSIKALVAQGAPASITSLANVTPPSGGQCASADCSSVLSLPVTLVPAAHLQVSIDSATTLARPGSSMSWTVDVRNLGAETAGEFSISDVSTDAVAVLSWTCAGLECPAAAGVGPINQTVRSLAVYDALDGNTPDGPGKLVFTVHGRVESAPEPSATFSAKLTPSTGDTCAPVSCQSKLQLPTELLGSSQLTLSLIANVSAVDPNSTIQYMFRLTNTGGADVFGINAYSVEPVDIVSSSWTCAATGTANCTPGGSGAINESISFMPIGTSVTFTITAITASVLQPTVDFLAGVGGGVPLTCVPAACSVSLSLPNGSGALPPLSISKTADRSILDPNGTVRYTLTVANSSSTDAISVLVADPIPPGLVSFAWTCISSDGVSCPANSGTDGINQLIGILPASTVLTYSVQAIVAGNAAGAVANLATLLPQDATLCTPATCSAMLTLPVRLPAIIQINKSAVPPSGTAVGINQAIAWTLLASNTGAPSSAPVILTDALPIGVAGISVTASAGVTCNTLVPQPGSNLICIVPAGFTGQRKVDIHATVSAAGTGSVTNTVIATGANGPTCGVCSVTNPVGPAIDIALLNPRPFSAVGIQGTLIDVVNLSPTTAAATTLSVSPSSALRLLAGYATGCTATEGAGGSVVVSCPNPPGLQGISCVGNVCSLGPLQQNAAMTVFVALNGASSASVKADAIGDDNFSNNVIVLPLGSVP